MPLAYRMRAHGTITSLATRLAEARRRRLSSQRAPSSVVEHVTFNHGVPGSIPGGPNLRSLTREELRLASHPACEGCPPKRVARRWTSPIRRSFGWQAKRVPLVERGLPRCCTAADDRVTHWLLAEHAVCRHERPGSRGTTVALVRPIPRARVRQWRPITPCK